MWGLANAFLRQVAPRVDYGVARWDSSRRVDSSARTPRMSSRLSGFSVAWLEWPRPSGPHATTWPRWPPTGCKGWRPWHGMNAMASGSETPASPAPQPRGGPPPRPPDEAVQAARAWVGREEGRQQYPRRAGVERTRSQAVRSYGLRHAWYWGAAKTHLQHVATWAARTIDRLVAWCNERPRAKSRTSRFAALAPVCAMS